MVVEMLNGKIGAKSECGCIHVWNPQRKAFIHKQCPKHQTLKFTMENIGLAKEQCLTTIIKYWETQK